MKIGDRLVGTGLILLAAAIIILTFEPTTVVTEPDPRFNVEVHSFANGSAQFEYTPVTNRTSDFRMSYTAQVDGETVRNISSETVEGISRNRPIRVYVEAQPDQTVSVEMVIWSTDGRRLHRSTNVIGPAE